MDSAEGYVRNGRRAGDRQVAQVRVIREPLGFPVATYRLEKDVVFVVVDEAMPDETANNLVELIHLALNSEAGNGADCRYHKEFRPPASR
jgi:hypothetical protein